MSPGSESILVTVDIQSNNARIVELTKQLNDTRDALKALATANKDGAITSDELVQKQVQLGATSKQAKNEIALLTRSNNEQTKANEAAAGSIEQLRAQLALSTKAYNSLSQSERDSSEAGQKLQASNKGLSDQLKALEKAVGDTRRSVGDYNTGVKDVNVVNGKLAGGFREAIDKGLSPFKEKMEQTGGILGKFRSGSDLVKEGLNLIKGAGETGSLGFKAIAGGIALTGIGLFVIAISAVVSYFTQTAEGGKILAQVLGGLGAVIQVGADVLTGFGRALVQAFTSPKEAAKQLVGFLESQVINRFKAFGVILDAVGRSDFKGVANGILQLGTGVEDMVGKGQKLITVLGDASQAGAALAAEQKAILRARQALAPEEAKEEARVGVLLRLTKERGKTAAEQLDALKEANQIEAESSAKKLALLRREQAAIEEGIRLKGAGRAADLKADLSAKKTEVEQAVGSRDETNARLKVRTSVFVQQQRDAAKAAALASRQDEVRDRQARLDTLLLDVTKGSAAELEIKKQFVLTTRDMDLTADKLTADQKKLIRAKALAEIKALEEDFQLKQLELAKKAAEKDAKTVAARLTEVNREYAEAEKLLQDFIANKKAAVEQAFADGKIAEGQYQKQINAIDKAGNEAALVNAKDYGKASGLLLKKQADDEIKERNRVKAEKKKIKDTEGQILEASIQAAQTATDVVIDVLGKETAAGQTALAIKKTLALAEVAINLEKQLSANAVAAAEIKTIPVVGIALGTAYEITADAVSIAGAIASAAKIAGFATGGYVTGPGTGTSDSVPAMLSSGESVMNANTTATYAPLLSYLNQLGGGVAFSGPSTGGRPIDGGQSARAIGAAGLIDYKLLAGAIAAQPISVDVRTIAAQQGRIARSRSLTTLG